jgi:hypothetical protein
VDWISFARPRSTLVFNTVPPRPRIACRITSHIPLAVRDEKGGRSWLHQHLYFPDEVVADPDCMCDGGADTPRYGADRRAGQRCAEHQAREETHRGTAQDVGRGRKRFSAEREQSVEGPHDHRHVLENEEVLVPPQIGDLVANLMGPLHVNPPSVSTWGRTYIKGKVPIPPPIAGEPKDPLLARNCRSRRLQGIRALARRTETPIIAT